MSYVTTLAIECQYFMGMKMHILLTGGTSDIAKSCCRYLADKHHLLVLSSHPENIEQKNNIKIYRSDFNYPEQCLKTVKSVLKEEKIDAIINISGINNKEKFGSVSVQGVIETFLINTITPYLLTEMIINDWIKHKTSGNVINISSIKASEASSNPSYGASKIALEHFSKTIAKNVGKYNIKINNIALSPLYSTAEKMPKQKKLQYLQKISQQRFCSIDDILSLIEFLLTSNTYINGQTIKLDGGYNL